MKKILPGLKTVICTVACIAVLITFVCMAFGEEKKTSARQGESVLTVWQIDSFEGGKGSRADFLQSIGKDFAKSNPCYINVLSISSDAARMNLSDGNIPDIISYGAGTYGIETYLSDRNVWCRGGYCVLTIDGDFSDISANNTVVNRGKDNFADAAALFCALQEADSETPTGAYVKLINGNYEYLLGTQRDIYRLKTRGVSFKIKPVTEFNDLYQNISVTADCAKKEIAEAYVGYLLTRTGEVNKVGMISDGVHYEDEMREMENLSFDYKLTSPISEEVRRRIEQCVSDGDINILKTLFN